MSEWYLQSAPTPNSAVASEIRAAQDKYLAPAGVMGMAAELAVQLASLQGKNKPALENVALAVFAADHGVFEEQVSAQPATYTQDMLKAIVAGESALSALVQQAGLELSLINLGTRDLQEVPGIANKRIALGTANICKGEAMDAAQFAQAMQVGADTVDSYSQLDCFIGGELGVGNSSCAAAIAVALTRLAASAMVGPGLGLNAQGVQRKTATVTKALSRHLPKIRGGSDALQRLGGFELAALAGAYIRAAQRGAAVLVDGYVATAVAQAVVDMNPSVRPYLIFSHCSAEPGHARLLAKMDTKPVLQLEMFLGQGAGALMALPVLKAVCALS